MNISSSSRQRDYWKIIFTELTREKGDNFCQQIACNKIIFLPVVCYHFQFIGTGTEELEKEQSQSEIISEPSTIRRDRSKSDGTVQD